MTKQEKIREGIVGPICEACMPYICAHWDLPPKERLVKCKPLRNWIDRILKSESDKGVVIKSEKELPRTPSGDLYSAEDMLDAGYVAVEGLL